MNLNRKGRAALVLALVVVVGMAFRVSWNALRDIANAVGADGTAATLYPFVVDGLMALALVATLVLADRDRTFALRVLGTYTLASLVLNYVHGLVPELHGTTVAWGQLADWGPANWALVLLATSLPVGSIYFGSDLVAKVLHHRPPVRVPGEAYGAGRAMPAHHSEATARPVESPAPDGATPTQPEVQEGTPVLVEEGTPPVRSVAPPAVHVARTAGSELAVVDARSVEFEVAELERMRQDARRAYAESALAARPLSARALGEAFGMSESWGRKQILAARSLEAAVA